MREERFFVRVKRGRLRRKRRGKGVEGEKELGDP